MALRMVRLSRLIPALLLAACASGGTEEAEPAATPGNLVTDLAIIEIMHNDPRVTSTATVLIEPQAGGVRATLGVVEPGQTRQFAFNAPAGNYQLIVPGVKNSESFRVSNREIATWDMQLNRVRVRNKN
jgi:hypothetical protein